MLQTKIREFIGHDQVGNGHATSAWFDTWSIQGPLASFVTKRDIARVGFFSAQTKVSELIFDGGLRDRMEQQPGHSKPFYATS